MKGFEKIIGLYATRKMRWYMIVACIGATVASYADSGCFINIHGTSDAYNLSYDLVDVDKLTFDSDNMNVHFKSSANYTTVPYFDMQKITFGERAFSGVEETTTSASIDIKYLSASQTIAVVGNEPLTQLHLYNMQGQLLHSVSTQSNSFTLQVASYPAGVYIVKAVSGDKAVTKKIIK